MKQKITYQPTYRGIRIQTDAQRGLGCIENILEGVHDRLTYMTSKYNQVSVAELVVTLPQSVSPGNGNMVVAEAIRATRKTMANNGIETQSCWSRENAPESSDHSQPHYHITFISDGAKCQSGMGIAKNMQKLIAKRSSGPVNDPGNVHCCQYRRDEQDLHPVEKASSIKIRQDKPGVDRQFENVFNRFSYNVKANKKGDTAPRQREYGFSQLPKG